MASCGRRGDGAQPQMHLNIGRAELSRASGVGRCGTVGPLVHTS